MDILVIGGTRFLGRRIVESALAKGHKVTMFNRGKDGAELFEGEVERITGDRDGELQKLGSRRWDAVIDTPGYFPRVVRASAEYLQDKVDRYLFISTISVYDPEPGATTIDEDTRKATLKDDSVEEITGETYGGLKVLCERAVDEIYGDRAIHVRPGYIVGSYDPSDRFTYYVWRLMQGGEMLAGGRPEAPLQMIDARDAGRFCIDLLEQGASGPFNACGPERPLSWNACVTRAKEALGANTRLTWVEAETLEKAGLQPGADLPLYQGSDPIGDAFMSASNAKAVEKGLTFTPLEDTVRDIAEWLRGMDGFTPKVGMTLERERELLNGIEAAAAG